MVSGLEDDDSDIEALDSQSNQNSYKKKGQKKKDEEKELKNEIIELEKTFESLDLDNAYSNNTNPRTRGLYRSSTLDNGYSTYAPRPTKGPMRPPVAFGTPVAKPLKFSWQEAAKSVVVDKDNDDWNYKQVRFFTMVIISQPVVTTRVR